MQTNHPIRSSSLRPLIAALCLTQVTIIGPVQAADPFDYFRNSWNVIGLKDYRDGTRVTPDNRLVLADNQTFQIRFGRDLTALSRKQTKTLLEGWLPIIQLAAEDGSVRYEFTFWATPLPTVKDWHKAFDWPTEGENFLNWIVVKATNTGKEPARAELVFERISAAKTSTNASAAKPSAPDRLSQPINPRESVECVRRIPFSPLPPETAAVLDKESAATWLQRTVDYWQTLLAQGAQITVPCAKATQTLRAAHVCQLIANDLGEMHAGEGFYDEFYMRDAAYQLMELEEAGLTKVIRKAIEPYLRGQRPDGRFETQKDQFDANGQTLWTLWQFYKITGDRPWLEKAYPQMRRATDWIKQARRQAPTNSPCAGLLPAAPADGEFLWDGKHHIVGYDIWNLRGLLVTADAAQILGRKAEAEELLREADLYRAAIDAACQRVGLAHFPPSWEKDGTHWGNTETLWPTPLFAADDPRVVALIKHARQEQGGGFCEGTIRWLGHAGAIHPYMSAYTTMADLVRGQHEQVVEDFYWYLLHSTAAHAFPEGIYYKRRFAWGNTIPHPTGAGNYALMLRHMLLHEQGSELHLLPAVPDWWLGDGEEIRVARAPTHFGPVSFSARGTPDGVKFRFDPPKREPPQKIVLHLPRSRPLVETSVRGVEVAVRSDQAQRWDFPTVVLRYTMSAGPLLKPIPGLVGLPLATPLGAEQCQTLNLTSLANTDPFTAPFGVEKPGRLLFTGLPTGAQTVAGVPFEIIDPAQNQGRGLVVLHSPQAPADRTWPEQVEIPVGAAGKRVFFLGNVHGWGLDDSGTGPWGAVAEYVIHYTDGQTQTVPLITGRTADDWANPPDAEEVSVGLQGDPWHLHVLGATLRPVPVEKIVFRDLGTPAAPVLAAVTIEK
jgi:hypothetical protein